MIDRENRAVVCDECGDVLEEAYTVDDEGCYCLDCAMHIAREKLTNSNEVTSVTVDRVSINHLRNEKECY